MNFLISVLSFVGVFSFLVFFHELGHFSVARKFGVKIDRFSIGFGPSLWSRVDKKGTEWRVSAIPLGGYIKFFGDANEAGTPSADMQALSDEEKESCFQFKPLSQRTLIVAAGPIANLALAALLFSAVFAINGQPYSSPEITAVQEGSVADEAGIQPGDVILSLNAYRVKTFEDISSYISMNADQPVHLIIQRGDKTESIRLIVGSIEFETPFGRTERIGRLGVIGSGRIIVDRNPIEALWYGTAQTGDYIILTLKALGQFITGQRSIKELGGPLKIGEISGEVAQYGFLPLVLFTALLSINLGVINLFPIPMLDGGHLLFYIIEAIKKKPVRERTQEYSFRVGLVAILSLMIVITWNDAISLIDRLSGP
ncbi:MAG: RIP metalloprotease RseP [Alphaproteobacteria bacterium]|nr:MAG: RIP metalloprotease RseP [Alphaproteobacteria bacterium]